MSPSLVDCWIFKIKQCQEINQYQHHKLINQFINWNAPEYRNGNTCEAEWDVSAVGGIWPFKKKGTNDILDPMYLWDIKWSMKLLGLMQGFFACVKCSILDSPNSLQARRKWASRSSSYRTHILPPTLCQLRKVRIIFIIGSSAFKGPSEGSVADNQKIC